LKNRSIKALNLIKNLSSTKWGGDRITLLRLYRSIIRSKIDYGSFVYWTASRNIIEKLDPVHNSAIRLALGAFKSSPVPSLYAESGEPSLEIRRKQLALQYYVRCKQNPSLNVHQTIINHQQLTNQEQTKTFSEKIKDICQDQGIFNTNILQSTENAFDPIWLLPPLKCDEFHPPNKGNTTANNLKTLFTNHIIEYHREALSIYTDGSKMNGQVGCAAVGIGNPLTRKLSPQTGIFTAELYAILDAVNKIKETNSPNRSVIFTDSQSTLSALSSYNPSHPLICMILNTILEIHSHGKAVQFCWVPAHVGIEKNEEADAAAKMAAAENSISRQPTYFKDLYPIIRQETKQQWQQIWTDITNNKLRNIKPKLEHWPSSSQKDRKTEVLLCRLRIGHTLTTHRHYMERTPPPFCNDCLVPLTVMHFIAECPSLLGERRRFFPETAHSNNATDTLRIILAEQENLIYNVKSLKNYLTAINIIDEI